MIFKYRIFSEQLQLVSTSFSFLIPAYSLGGGETKRPAGSAIRPAAQKSWLRA